MMIRCPLWAVVLGGLSISFPAAGQPPESRTSATLEYGLIAFARELEPWHLISAELQRRTGVGSAIVRGNLARRFGETGQQFEADVYPRLGPKAYAYLNAGYSPSGLFPQWRFGAEIFGILSDGLEVSLGARRLEFEPADVNLLTGSLGVYAGDLYVSLRPTLSRKNEETGVSGSVLIRRYLGAADTHVSVRAGGGESLGENATAIDLERTTWLGGGLEGERPLGDRWGIVGSVGGQREELPGGRERRRISLSLGLEARF